METVSEKTTKNAYVTWIPDICVYHGDCDDGFAAAWVVKNKWPDVELIAGAHGRPLLESSYRDMNILFVDFSLPKEQLISLGKVAKSIVILDHRKTAKEALSDWNIGSITTPDSALKLVLHDISYMIHNQKGPIIAYFDDNLSGAGMAWKFCHPTDDLPPALAYIQDRDLWKFQFRTKADEFSAALRMYEQDIVTWDFLMKNPELLITEGKIALRAHEYNCFQIIKQRYPQTVKISHLENYVVPCVNATHQYASDVAELMLTLHKSAPFALSWFRRYDGKFQFSLRSTHDRVDVSVIAKAFGGGGHRNAAGFQLDNYDDLENLHERN